MKNFNTNQARHFYTAVRNRTGEASMDNVGDITLVTVAPEQNGAPEAICFKYRNGNGDITRTDSVDVKKVKSINLKEAEGTPLKMYTVAINSSVFDISNKKLFVNNDALGKTFVCRVHVSELYDYDASNDVTIAGAIVGDATNLGSADAFYKALACSLANALPATDPKNPLFRVFVKTTEVTKGMKVADLSGVSSISGIVIVQSPQKFVLGKLSGEPCPIDVTVNVKVDNYTDVAWGNVTAADSNISGYIQIPGAKQLAELEYFALGERGDYYRGFRYPDDYDHSAEYLIDITKTYKVLTLEYYWNGNAETVQKSPRTLQIAAEISGSGSQATCILDGLYSSVLTALGLGTGSGSGA